MQSSTWLGYEYLLQVRVRYVVISSTIYSKIAMLRLTTAILLFLARTLVIQNDIASMISGTLNSMDYIDKANSPQRYFFFSDFLPDVYSRLSVEIEQLRH